MYCERKDLEFKTKVEKVQRLASDKEMAPETGWTDEVVADAIRAAQAHVDEVFCSQYEVPFAEPVPDLVRDLTARLALFFLYQRSREPLVLQPGEIENIPFSGIWKELEEFRQGRRRIPGRNGKYAAKLVDHRAPGIFANAAAPW